MKNSIPKNENEWKERLSAKEYEVLRKKSTEAPFSGRHLETHRKGMFLCKGCGAQLFDSETKFDSGTGWPSFDTAIEGAVDFIEDDSHAMKRTEVVCSTCKSHLGHVFDDGPTETGKRFCINSVCLDHKATE